MKNKYPVFSLEKCIMLIISVIAAAIFQTVSAVGALSEGIPVLAKEVLIDADQGGVPEPHTVIRFGADSLVIAGTSRLTAWAMRADFDGKANWRYASGILSQFQGKSAQFNGAVPMDDGTTFLCGSISGIRPYSPGLLTRIDANGRLLSERPIYPQGRSEHGIASLKDCVKWGDGLLLLGSVMQFDMSGQKNLYWLVMLDHAGEISWEKLIQTNFDRASQPVITANSHLIFFEHARSQTRISNIASTGEVESQKILPGNWMPIYKKTATNELQIYGEDNGKGTAISLNENFIQMERHTYNLPEKLITGFACRFSDQAVILVGRGLNRESQVCRADTSSGNVSCLALNHPPFIEAALLTAVVPIWDKNEVLSVRPLLRQMSDGPVPAGLALNFVNAQ